MNGSEIIPIIESSMPLGAWDSPGMAARRCFTFPMFRDGQVEFHSDGKGGIVPLTTFKNVSLTIREDLLSAADLDSPQFRAIEEDLADAAVDHLDALQAFRLGGSPPFPSRALLRRIARGDIAAAEAVELLKRFAH